VLTFLTRLEGPRGESCSSYVGRQNTDKVQGFKVSNSFLSIFSAHASIWMALMHTPRPLVFSFAQSLKEAWEESATMFDEDAFNPLETHWYYPAS
jgi:hypothetical protein